MTSVPSLTLWYSPQACSIAPLNEAELDFQLVLAEVDRAKDERFTDEFKALNPKKRVPVLKMNDEIITEVPAIVIAISSLAPDRKFLGQTTLDTIRVYVVQLPWRSGTCSSIWRTLSAGKTRR